MNLITLSIKEIKEFYELRNTDKYIDSKGDIILNKDSIVLTRVTNIFPNNLTVTSKALDYVLDDVRKYASVFHKYFEDNDIDNEPYIKYYSARSTIHFTINSLVSNQNMSNFTDSKYFIFDLLKNHIDDTLISLREEDTFYKDEFKLSHDAFICMTKETYDSLDDKQKKVLDNLKSVFIYDGEIFNTLNLTNNNSNNKYLIEESIVGLVLDKMGYISYTLDPDGFKYENVMEKNILSLLDYLRKDLDISNIKHFFSESNKQDSVMFGINIEKSLKRHFEYIVTNSNIDTKLKNELLNHREEIGSYYSNDIYILVNKLLDKIGTDEYIHLTLEYNNILEKERLELIKDK